MLFEDYSYSPQPAMPDQRLICHVATKEMDEMGQTEYNDYQYQIHPQHRNHNRKKSQWIVSYEDELSVFAWAMHESAIDESGQYAWGLYTPGSNPDVLGITTDNKESRIAVFDNGKNNGFWHGYPANIRKQERPADDILASWRILGLINKSDLRKIVCALW